MIFKATAGARHRKTRKLESDLTPELNTEKSNRIWLPRIPKRLLLHHHAFPSQLQRLLIR